MTQKMKTVPNLRFPGFDGKWNHIEIGSIAKTITSGSRDWAQHYADTGSKFIRMTNLPRGGIQLLLDDMKFVELPEDSSEGKRTSLEAHDILISITAELGKIGWVPPNFGIAYINQHTALVRLDLERADARFVAHLLSSEEMNNNINSLNDSGAKAGLNLPTIRTFPLHLPALPEQQKIADFLTSVDVRLQQLNQKKALLEDYKKGVMQQLFTQALRFKDDHGNEFPDWEEETLGNVCKIRTGKKDVNEGNPNGAYPFFTCAKKHTFSDSFSFDAKAVLIAGNGEVGHCQFYEGKFEAYQRTYVLTDFKRSEDYIFIYLNHFFRAVVDQQKQMGAMPYIKIGMLTDFAIPFPTSFEEQTKITNFLSALDRKIETVAAQITHTQTFKKGLLQQMFV